MDTKQVIKILIFFRDIEKEIKLLHRIIDDFENQYYTPGGGVSFDSPIVTTGGTSAPTERTALNVPESVMPSCQELEKRIKNLADIKREVFIELAKLTYIQKSVIYGFYVEQMQWAKIAMREHCSRETCIRHKKRGVKKLQVYFNANTAIKTFFEKTKS